MIPNEIADEFDQCIKCGLCQATCPVCKELLLEKYTPRGKIQLARRYGQDGIDASEHLRDIYARCLLCGACTVTCPSGVDLRKVFLGMRERIAGKRGIHPAMKKAAESVSAHRNISDEDNLERADWTDSLKHVPARLFQKDKAEVVYFVGCVASFFPMVQSIPVNMVRIMDRANVDFALLGGEEWCCGFPLVGAGVPDRMDELIRHNLDRVKALGAREVVFSCPTCYCTWKDYYKADLALYHSTEFLDKMISEGHVPLKEMAATVTYHDPCDLGRNSGVFDAPRRILKAVPGLKLVELENNRLKSVCCGGGGNVEMVDPDLSAAVAQKKLEEIERTGAKIVVTSCQQCIRTIKGKARKQKLDLEVMDVTEVVLRAMK
ncbi:MAG: (Fe-S)-binding protein [Candidatus Desulfacyla sp.]